MMLWSRRTPVQVVVALCLVAGVFSPPSTREAEPSTGDESVAPATLLRPSDVPPLAGVLQDTVPPRQIAGLHWIKNGWVYDCMECHKIVKARWHYEQPPNEHKQIILDHGNNRFCLNCHHPANRNAFVDYDGAEIAEQDVVQLCAKCHGTIYRDWTAGVHGRQNGFWKVSLGAKAKLRCIECHDPHSPKFKSLEPLAPLRYPPRGAHPPAVAHSAGAAQSTGP